MQPCVSEGGPWETASAWESVGHVGFCTQKGAGDTRLLHKGAAVSIMLICKLCSTDNLVEDEKHIEVGYIPLFTTSLVLSLVQF